MTDNDEDSCSQRESDLKESNALLAELEEAYKTLDLAKTRIADLEADGRSDRQEAEKALELVTQQRDGARRALVAEVIARKAANARIAELDAQHVADSDRLAEAVRHQDRALARAEEAESRFEDLQQSESEASQWKAKCEAAERALDVLAREKVEAFETSWKRAESEAASLRAQVDRLRDEGDETRQDRNDAESGLAEARAQVDRVRAVTAWSPCPAEPEEDDDGPLYQGFITDPGGTWVKVEDLVAALADCPKYESESAALRGCIKTQDAVMRARTTELKVENATLRTEVERSGRTPARKREIQALASLAEARALLGRWCQSRDFNYGESAVEAETQRWLSANPESPRAAAERAVLDACSELHEQALARLEDDYTFSDVAASELARRAVKP